MVYQGHVIHGVIVLDESVHLPEGLSVQVTLSEQPTEADAGPASSLSIEEEIAAIAAAVPADAWSHLPRDLSDQLDHYLYGTPKR